MYFLHVTPRIDWEGVTSLLVGKIKNKRESQEDDGLRKIMSAIRFIYFYSVLWVCLTILKEGSIELADFGWNSIDADVLAHVSTRWFRYIYK